MHGACIFSWLATLSQYGDHILLLRTLPSPETWRTLCGTRPLVGVDIIDGTSFVAQGARCTPPTRPPGGRQDEVLRTPTPSHLKSVLASAAYFHLLILPDGPILSFFNFQRLFSFIITSTPATYC